MESNEFLKKVNEAVMKKYPSAYFYEMDGVMNAVNGKPFGFEGINEKESKLVYGIDGKTIEAKLEGDSVVITEFAAPYMDCRPMTIFVPNDVDEALQRLFQADIVWKANPTVVLRFALYPGVIKPCYYFGSKATGIVSVGVYSGNVEVC